MVDRPASPAAGDRLAKVIARSGLCSRRDAEDWIRAGRVSVNGKPIKTPAFNVVDTDKIAVDGAPLMERQGTRVWLYHKPAGLVVTEKDPEGRPTIFEALSRNGLPRVVTVGRLDINTEGLLLLTNDGGLKRVLELPATGWLRRYRVRAYGSITQAALDALKDGVEVEGIKYGPIEATLERQQGSNVWLLVGLREGKNREVKKVLSSLGLEVNRLIRISFGPFQLGDIPIGAVETVKSRVLREQLGRRLAQEAGADFDSEMPIREPLDEDVPAATRRPARPHAESRSPAPRTGRGRDAAPGRFDRRADQSPQRVRHVYFDDDRAPEVYEPKGRPPRRQATDGGDRPRSAAARPKSGADGRPSGKPSRMGAEAAGGAARPKRGPGPKAGARAPDRSSPAPGRMRTARRDDRDSKGPGARGEGPGARGKGPDPGGKRPGQFKRADGTPSGRRPRAGARMRTDQPAGKPSAPRRPKS